MSESKRVAAAEEAFAIGLASYDEAARLICNGNTTKSAIEHVIVNAINHLSFAANNGIANAAYQRGRMCYDRLMPEWVCDWRCAARYISYAILNGADSACMASFYVRASIRYDEEQCTMSIRRKEELYLYGKLMTQMPVQWQIAASSDITLMQAFTIHGECIKRIRRVCVAIIARWSKFMPMDVKKIIARMVWDEREFHLRAWLGK